MVDGQVQVTTQRVKGGRKAVIPSSIDAVDKLEHIGKETVTKLLDIQGTADSADKKLPDTQDAADRTVRKRYGHIVIPSHHIKSVLNGASSALRHLTWCAFHQSF